MTDPATPREALLEAAGHVLERAHFAVRIESLTGSDQAWLLAENELFALGAIEGETLDDLERVESTAAQALLSRFGNLERGAKRWDAYLLLLTPQSWSSLDDRNRVEFVYNTRGIRRLIGADLIADETGDIREAVTRVLRPFLPLGEPLGGALADLDDALINSLVVNGVEREDAQRYVAAFRVSGSLDDV
jgi:hypothetical protein